MTAGPLRVLFVCVHNSARSIMAEALLREQGGAAFEAGSAGIQATVVHPLTLRVLSEIGIDASRAHSRTVDSVLGAGWDLVITVCDPAQEACPVVPGARMLHWSFDDPAAAGGTDEERLIVFRRVRDEIAAQVRALVRGSPVRGSPVPAGLPD